jgi:hypothetical protein
MILNLGSYFKMLTLIDSFKRGFSDAEQRSVRQEAKGGYDVSMYKKTNMAADSARGGTANSFDRYEC